MKQQVDITITFEFDTEIGTQEIKNRVSMALVNSEVAREFCQITSIKEEAEIYGNK
jgi:hypothetical protein|tara:strand:+ start:2450 stop:2617 length:168 start_codon:yes stop_codon:yes gene_type:complete